MKRSVFFVLSLLAAGVTDAAWAGEDESVTLAYVANAANNHVQILNVDTGETVKKLYTGAAPWRLMLTPDGKRLVVQHWYAETTAVVYLDYNRVQTVLPVRGPGVFTPDGERLLTYSWPNTTLTSYDAKKFELLKTDVTDDKLVYDMVFWGKDALVKGRYDPMTQSLRTTYNQVVIAKLDDPKGAASNLRTGLSPAKLVVDPSGEFLLTANFDDRQVSILNKLGDGRQITLAQGPRDIVFSRDGRRMVVICWGAGSRESDIFTLNTDFKARPWPTVTAEKTRHFKGGFTAAAIGADGRLYVLDRPGGRLVVLDAETLEDIKSIPVGDEPMSFVLRRVPKSGVPNLMKKSRSERMVENAIEKIRAATGAPFTDVSFTETITIQEPEDADAKSEQAKKAGQGNDAGKAGAKASSKTVTSTVKTMLRLPDSVRQEFVDGAVRLAQGGRAVAITKEGRYLDTPRQELLYVVFALGGLSTEEAMRQLAGDVPGSPFLRNGIALDLVDQTIEDGHEYLAIGTLEKGLPVSQLWISGETGLPVDLVEQFPVMRSKSPHEKAEGFQGLTETKLHYHDVNGQPFPVELSRYIDGQKRSDVKIADIKFDQNLPPGRFDLAQLGGVLKPVSKRPAPAPGEQSGPGLAVASLGTAHIDTPLDEHPEYNTHPPASGHHTRYTADYGVHKIPIPPEVQVGNLINGAVLLQYNCPQGCADLVKQLEAMADKYGNVIVAPYPLMESKIALTAWQRIETLKDYDEKRVSAFIEAYAGKRHPHNKEDLPEDPGPGDMMMPSGHPPMQAPPMMPQK